MSVVYVTVALPAPRAVLDDVCRWTAAAQIRGLSPSVAEGSDWMRLELPLDEIESLVGDLIAAPAAGVYVRIERRW